MMLLAFWDAAPHGGGVTRSSGYSIRMQARATAVACCIASLCNHIAHIADRITQEEMAISYARRVVTLMASKLARLKTTFEFQGECENVGIARALVIGKFAIAGAILGGKPYPAWPKMGLMRGNGAVLVNFSPEPFKGRLGPGSVSAGCRAKNLSRAVSRDKETAVTVGTGALGIDMLLEHRGYLRGATPPAVSSTVRGFLLTSIVPNMGT